MQHRLSTVSPRSAIQVASEAADRATYLRRPDHGRQLNAASRAALERIAGAPCDLALVIADGLSAAAVHAHAVRSSPPCCPTSPRSA